MALTRSDVESIVEAKFKEVNNSIEDARKQVGLLMQAAEAKLIQVEGQAQLITQKTKKNMRKGSTGL